MNEASQACTILMEKDFSAKGESVCIANSAIKLRVEGTHSWIREQSETVAGCVSSTGQARLAPPSKSHFRENAAVNVYSVDYRHFHSEIKIMQKL